MRIFGWARLLTSDVNDIVLPVATRLMDRHGVPVWRTVSLPSPTGFLRNAVKFLVYTDELFNDAVPTM
jgi:hypothetical protein